MPPLEDIYRTATCIADVTVTGYTEDKLYLKITNVKVHSLLKGEKSPAQVKGIRLTCIGLSASESLEKDKRYIIIMRGEDLFGDGMAFPVRVTEKGVLECISPRDPSAWITIVDLKKEIEAAIKAGAKP